jgi:uracil-DNA glycosylase
MKKGIDISRIFEGVSGEWIKAFTSPPLMPHLKNVLDVLIKEKSIDSITPHPNDMFNFARNTKYGQITVIIVGDSPYTQAGTADGMCYSSTSAVPTPLQNIYRCLIESKKIVNMPSGANLTHWAEQGVLLLNRSLTTRVGEVDAHKDAWHSFTNELIKYLSTDTSSYVGWSLPFMLWCECETLKQFIDPDHIIYEWKCLPSDEKFINCDHFTLIDKFLSNEADLPAIKWGVACEHIVYTDGACSNNGKNILSRTGYAAYFPSYAEPIVKYGKVGPVFVNKETIHGTNQRGEGLGIVCALETLIGDTSCTKLTIVTDSQFWITMITEYMPSWERKGIDFNDKKNPDITIKLNKLVQQFETTRTLTLEHVKSHGKDANANAEHVKGNDIADKYAVIAKKLNDYRTHTELL